ncbi:MULTISPECIES: 50S ribosomal protein bL37 [Rothia]|uniref:50S ribosomal protein bL37 n=1 Tax=Rothia sp. (in: high G+C Gram-positive bacteria) TaxID=1885016 RepID=UPI001CB0B22F|nr:MULTISPECIES: hypothetical protein [Rothia]MBF1655326.1 hypothetical protein [Rothia sp. (in: high G+C Gram-positive bacteria)]MBF1680366.1 hypothetical protein [Rothia sp. (in: high G+C Gram-positive bacteria)]
MTASARAGNRGTHREGGACIHEHYKEALMSKRGRKRKDRRKGGANHGKRPNA